MNQDSPSLDASLIPILSAQPDSARLLERALLDACLQGKDTLVSALLLAGVDPNSTDDKRRSCMHRAAAITDPHLCKQSASIIRLLSEAGAKPRPSTIHVVGNCLALHALLTAGADINAKTVEGCSALASAVTSGRDDVAVDLLALGVPPESGLLFKTRSPDVIRALCRSGADPNISDVFGSTPLSLAVVRGDRNIARALLENGARDEGGDRVSDRASDIERGATDSSVSPGIISVAGSLQDLLCAISVAQRNFHTWNASEIAAALGALQAVTRTLTDLSSRGPDACIVCLKSPKVVVMMPCRHLCVCAGCSSQVKTCPVCRASVESCLSVFT